MLCVAHLGGVSLGVEPRVLKGGLTGVEWKAVVFNARMFRISEDLTFFETFISLMYTYIYDNDYDYNL